MQTQQLVRASADVITITTLRPGDVYKRVSTDYQGEGKLAFGIVTDTMNNGEDAAVTALEFTPAYNGVTTAQKVIAGGRAEALFPAAPDEVRQHFVEVTEALTKAEAAAEAALEKAREERERVLGIIGRVGAELTAPQTITGAGSAVKALAEADSAE